MGDTSGTHIIIGWFGLQQKQCGKACGAIDGHLTRRAYRYHHEPGDSRVLNIYPGRNLHTPGSSVNPPRGTPKIDPAIQEGCESGSHILEVQNLVVEREERRLLDGVSFSIACGECLAVSGPSGAGKSLLLRCLNRLVEPTEGAITLCGVDITAIDPPALRRRVCLVGQRPVLFPGTVRENLEYPFSFAANRNLPGPDFEAILEAIGLMPSLLERNARTLSGGEQQRVAIARAVAISPDVLLLDEPTSALDPESETLVEATIIRLNRVEGMTIVLVTHDRDQAERIGNRLMIIAGGRVTGINGRAADG